MARPELPAHGNRILGNQWVRADDYHLSGDCLTDQHSIKGVLMQRWKPAQFEGVGLGDRKFSDAMP